MESNVSKSRSIARKLKNTFHHRSLSWKKQYRLDSTSHKKQVVCVGKSSLSEDELPAKWKTHEDIPSDLLVLTDESKHAAKKHEGVTSHQKTELSDNKDSETPSNPTTPVSPASAIQSKCIENNPGNNASCVSLKYHVTLRNVNEHVDSPCTENDTYLSKNAENNNSVVVLKGSGSCLSKNSASSDKFVKTKLITNSESANPLAYESYCDNIDLSQSANSMKIKAKFIDKNCTCNMNEVDNLCEWCVTGRSPANKVAGELEPGVKITLPEMGAKNIPADVYAVDTCTVKPATRCSSCVRLQPQPSGEPFYRSGIHLDKNTDNHFIDNDLVSDRDEHFHESVHQVKHRIKRAEVQTDGRSTSQETSFAESEWKGDHCCTQSSPSDSIENIARIRCSETREHRNDLVKFVLEPIVVSGNPSQDEPKSSKCNRAQNIIIDLGECVPLPSSMGCGWSRDYKLLNESSEYYCFINNGNARTKVVQHCNLQHASQRQHHSKWHAMKDGEILINWKTCNNDEDIKSGDEGLQTLEKENCVTKHELCRQIIADGCRKSFVYRHRSCAGTEANFYVKQHPCDHDAQDKISAVSSKCESKGKSNRIISSSEVSDDFAGMMTECKNYSNMERNYTNKCRSAHSGSGIMNERPGIHDSNHVIERQRCGTLGAVCNVTDVMNETLTKAAKRHTSFNNEPMNGEGRAKTWVCPDSTEQNEFASDKQLATSCNDSVCTISDHLDGQSEDKNLRSQRNQADDKKPVSIKSEKMKDIVDFNFHEPYRIEDVNEKHSLCRDNNFDGSSVDNKYVDGKCETHRLRETATNFDETSMFNHLVHTDNKSPIIEKPDIDLCRRTHDTCKLSDSGLNSKSSENHFNRLHDKNSSDPEDSIIFTLKPARVDYACYSCGGHVTDKSRGLRGMKQTKQLNYLPSMDSNGYFNSNQKDCSSDQTSSSESVHVDIQELLNNELKQFTESIYKPGLIKTDNTSTTDVSKSCVESVKSSPSCRLESSSAIGGDENQPPPIPERTYLLSPERYNDYDMWEFGSSYDSDDSTDEPLVLEFLALNQPRKSRGNEYIESDCLKNLNSQFSRIGVNDSGHNLVCQNREVGQTHLLGQSEGSPSSVDVDSNHLCSMFHSLALSNPCYCDNFALIAEAEKTQFSTFLHNASSDTLSDYISNTDSNSDSSDSPPPIFPRQSKSYENKTYMTSSLGSQHQPKVTPQHGEPPPLYQEVNRAKKRRKARLKTAISKEELENKDRVCTCHLFTGSREFKPCLRHPYLEVAPPPIPKRNYNLKQDGIHPRGIISAPPKMRARSNLIRQERVKVKSLPPIPTELNCNSSSSHLQLVSPLHSLDLSHVNNSFGFGRSLCDSLSDEVTHLSLEELVGSEPVVPPRLTRATSQCGTVHQGSPPPPPPPPPVSLHLSNTHHSFFTNPHKSEKMCRHSVEKKSPSNTKCSINRKVVRSISLENPHTIHIHDTSPEKSGYNVAVKEKKKNPLTAIFKSKETFGKLFNKKPVSNKSSDHRKLPPVPPGSSASGDLSPPICFATVGIQGRPFHPIGDLDDQDHSTQNFINSLLKLREVGWYWGPLSLEDAEAKLHNKRDGSFLVRDSSHDSYILSLSFRSQNKTHHTRIEHCQGTFGFWSQPVSHGRMSIIEFIDKAMEHSRNGKFLYFLRPHAPGLPPSPVALLYPISRLEQMQSLQHRCRFIILKHVRYDHINQLPLPQALKQYLREKQYFAEKILMSDHDTLSGTSESD